MSDTLGAVLVAEIGSLITRVTLIDQVDGESRMVGHAETSSSVEPPYQNALFAIMEAAAQISETTGRQLLRDGQLIVAQGGEREGVTQVVVTTSAAGTMSLVITAIAADVSARSALHASRSTYTALLQVVTLDDAAAQPGLGAAEQSWIERQVQGLLSLRPDAVLIAGGLEHGAVDAVNRLAHIVGLTALNTNIDGGQSRQQLDAPPVIYAGNSDARERVVEALSNRAEISTVANLRPTLEQANLDPTRQELARLYERQIMPRLPGIGNLRRLSRAPLRAVCEIQGLMTRFLAERTGRRVLSVDVGASASTATYAAPGRFHPVVLGTIGTIYGLTELLAAVGPEAIARWLPFPIEEHELVQRLLNRLLRPQALASSREDLYLEHAVACEALRATMAALGDEAAVGDYDWLIAGGGVLAHAPQLGLALLTLLNGIEPTGEHDHPIVDVYLDTLGLMQVGGALAALDADAAVTVTDRDLLRNVPLASLVVLLGEGRAGSAAAELELSVVGGGVERRTVRHGELVRVALPQGRYGGLRLNPAAGVRVGRAGAGEALATEGGDLAGSALGLVIDARGRPLQLPSEPSARQARIWEWLIALGAERGANPYGPSEPTLAPVSAPLVRPAPSSEPQVAAAPALVEVSAPEPAIEPMGRRVSLDQRATPTPEEVAADVARTRRISLDELAAQEQAQPSDASLSEPPAKLDSDLDALRQTVEPPKRRGLFGRKQ